MAEPETTASVTMQNVFTDALLSNYWWHGEKEGAQRKEMSWEQSERQEKKKKQALAEKESKKILV